VGPKRLELLREMVPTATTIALLVNPTNPSLAEPFTQALQAAAATLGIKLPVLQASAHLDFDNAFATLAQLRAEALVIMPDVFFNTRIRQLASLALRHTLPAIYSYRPFVAAGGLISYGASETEYYHLLGAYAAKILKGEARRPAGGAIHQGRADAQPQDRQGSRHHRAAIAARPRRRGDRMKRREFITLIGGTAVAWPRAGQTQQAGKLPRRCPEGIAVPVGDHHFGDSEHSSSETSLIFSPLLRTFAQMVGKEFST
jgi:ABC transporter substrate binding protein